MNKKALQELWKQKCSTTAVHNHDPRPDPSNHRWTVADEKCLCHIKKGEIGSFFKNEPICP